MQPIATPASPPCTSGNSPPPEDPQPLPSRAVGRQGAPAGMQAPAPWPAEIARTQPVRREVMAGRGAARAARSRQEHVQPGAVRSDGAAARRTPVPRQQAWSAKPGQRPIQRGTVDAAGANDGRSPVLGQRPQIAKIPTGPYGPFHGCEAVRRRGPRIRLRLAASDRQNPDRTLWTISRLRGRAPTWAEDPPPAASDRKNPDRTLWTISRLRGRAPTWAEDPPPAARRKSQKFRQDPMDHSAVAAGGTHTVQGAQSSPSRRNSEESRQDPTDHRTMGARAAAPGACPPAASRPESQLPAATLCTLARQHRTARRPPASPRARQQGGSHDRTRHLRLRR